MHRRELILQGLSSQTWFWFCLLVCIAAAGLILVLSRYERRLVSPAVGRWLLGLRLSVLAVILLTFLQPVVAWVLDQQRSARIIVAVDVSESMKTSDDHASRGELLRWGRALELIGNPAINSRLDAWIAALERGEEPQWVAPSEGASDAERQELAQIRRGNVDDILKDVRGLSRLELAQRLLTGTSQHILTDLQELGVVELRAFAGQSEPLDASTLATVLADVPPGLLPRQSDLNLAADFSSVESTAAVAGVVLLSDGRHNSGRDPVESAVRLGRLNTPLIPILLGSERRPRDISILSLDSPQVAFRNDSPVLKVRIAADGYRNEELTVALAHPDGRETSQLVRVPGDSSLAAIADVEFPLPAGDVGRFEYTLRTDVRPDETRDDNNSRAFSIQIVDDKARVLLVDGEARWEFRFLDNALDRDERIELTHVLYDQPYLRVLPTTFFPDQLRLPAKPEDLARSPLAELDLAIVGDVPPAKFSDESWQALEYFVRETGGTLVLIAGRNHMPQSHHSPSFLRLLPVRNPRPFDLLDGQSDQPPSRRGFRLRLTPDAERQTMFQFDTDPILNRDIWNTLPGHGWGMPGEARPGSTVYATASGAGGGALADERSDAVIVHQYYGFGQILWMGIDSTWRWRHRTGDTYHHRFWGQIARWAARNKASAGNEFVRLSLDRNQIESGDQTTIQVRWQPRFAELNPDLSAYIEAFPEPDDGTGRATSRLELRPVDGQPLVYQALVAGLPPGNWRLKLSALNANIGGDVSTTLAVSEPLTGELSDLSANRDLLSRMAEASGGRLLMPDQLDQLKDLLKPPQTNAEALHETSLWDHWLTLSLFFVLLTTEWVVRKLNGLP